MGYEIAICETEAENAPCRAKKLHIIRIKMPDGKFEELQGHDMVVSLGDAKKAFPDFEAFLSRNRINPESTCIYLDKVKKDEDVAILGPLAKSVATGWVDLDKIDPSQRDEVLAAGDHYNEVTEWQETDFEEATAMCENCPLAWNKGKNCLETFGPSNSKLPEIAQRCGCAIVASVPQSAESGRKFASADAEALLKEVEILRPALVADGKMAVHRYSGVLDRLEAMAKTCVDNNCGFYFF
ncbi:hypothetical protein TALC_00458 [Thermoplasmatales archaeon BRNA1]|nr:hypothetical protein TALC_00458 [Thermoplasmatales archaeon BRNA1]